MRLVTRSDFDGLACGALLKEAGIIDSWKFAHPKDLQDGLIEVNENDCLANVPFVEGCGLWFDHHSSEHERNELKGKYQGFRECHIQPDWLLIYLKEDGILTLTLVDTGTHADLFNI